MKIENHTLKTKTGFTLLEVTIGLAILLVIFSLGLFLSMDFYRTYSFRADENTAITLLRRARSRSLSNINQYEHGIKMVGANYVVFQGPGPNLTYASRVVSLDEVFPINSNIVVSWPAPSEVVFDQLTGNVDAAFLIGDIVITGPGKFATLSFNSEGRIDY